LKIFLGEKIAKINFLSLFGEAIVVAITLGVDQPPNQARRVCVL
jgi:hypothetical protein